MEWKYTTVKEEETITADGSTERMETVDIHGHGVWTWKLYKNPPRQNRRKGGKPGDVSRLTYYKVEK